MGLLSSIPIIGKLIDSTHDIVSQVVVDKDKQNEIFGLLESMRQEVYLAELGTKTVPWVDALHKMGRQILNIATITATVLLLLLDVEITPTIALVLGGGNVSYQLIKGVGK